MSKWLKLIDEEDSIDSLADVDTSTTAPNPGEALVWDAVAGWIPGVVLGSGDVTKDGTSVADRIVTWLGIGSDVQDSGVLITTVTDHLTAIDNPHATSISNLGEGTMLELGDALSDGWIKDVAPAIGDIPRMADVGGLPVLPVALGQLEDTNLTEGVGTNGYAVSWDNGAGEYVLTAAGAGDLLSAQNLLDLADKPTARVNLGLEIGADVQAYSAILAGTTSSYTVSQSNRLANMEDNADVTNDVSVAAAGAVMDTNFPGAATYPLADLIRVADGTYAALKRHYEAADPDPALDDADRDYAIGSRWVNTSTEEEFVCLDVTVGAAIWKSTTATADQTGAEIKAAYEAEADTNAFTDAEKTSLGTMEDGATGDQSAAEVIYSANGDLIATDVQAAIDELDDEKHPLATGSITGSNYLRDDNTWQPVPVPDHNALSNLQGGNGVDEFYHISADELAIRVDAIGNQGAASASPDEFFMVNDDVVPATKHVLKYSDGVTWSPIAISGIDSIRDINTGFMGRTGGTGNATTFDGVAAAALMGDFDGTRAGVVPNTSGDDATLALLGDGTFGAPSVPLANLTTGLLSDLEAAMSADLDVVLSSKAGDFVRLTDGPIVVDVAETKRLIVEDASTGSKQYIDAARIVGVEVEDNGTVEVNSDTENLFRSLNFTNLTTLGGSLTPSVTAGDRTLDITLPAGGSGSANNIALFERTLSSGFGIPSVGHFVADQTKPSTTTQIRINSAGAADTKRLFLTDEFVDNFVGKWLFIQNASDPTLGSAIFSVTGQIGDFGTARYLSVTHIASFGFDSTDWDAGADYSFQIAVNGAVKPLSQQFSFPTARTTTSTLWTTIGTPGQTFIFGLDPGKYMVQLTGIVSNAASGALIEVRFGTAVTNTAIVTLADPVIQQRANGGDGKQNIAATFLVEVIAGTEPYLLPEWQTSVGTATMHNLSFIITEANF